jgi:hypothetical protein
MRGCNDQYQSLYIYGEWSCKRLPWGCQMRRLGARVPGRGVAASNRERDHGNSNNPCCIVTHDCMDMAIKGILHRGCGGNELYKGTEKRRMRHLEGKKAPIPESEPPFRCSSSTSTVTAPGSPCSNGHYSRRHR